MERIQRVARRRASGVLWGEGTKNDNQDMYVKLVALPACHGALRVPQLYRTKFVTGRPPYLLSAQAATDDPAFT